MRIAFLLVALPLLAAAAPSIGATPIVEVHMTNFRFTPATIPLARGQAYVLRLVNDARGGHNFVASDFFAGIQVASPDRALIRDGAVEVPGGEARTIHFVAPAAGRYKVRCTHRLHSAFGMKGEIIVR